MRSGEEIQTALREFVGRWQDYAGSERGGAQTYLNELIGCYGADRMDVGAEFEDAHTANGIMDMHWPDVCIVEMKAPSQADKLPEHRKQALDYWHSSDDAAQNRPAPPYVVLCAFRRFEVWEPGRFPSAPRAEFGLDELPEHYETLLFLSGTDQEPMFGASFKELTTEAAEVVAELYQTLLERKAAAPETLRAFVLQVVWCLFAEDLGMLDGHPVQRIVEDLIRHPDRSSYADLGTLFDVLNDPSDFGRIGVYSGTQYVNGSLFAAPAKVHLNHDELLKLARAAEFDWRKVDPTIFGGLMEGCLGRDRRWELGAHYTHEVDIMKIVRPTILVPWREPGQAEGRGEHLVAGVVPEDHDALGLQLVARAAAAADPFHVVVLHRDRGHYGAAHPHPLRPPEQLADPLLARGQREDRRHVPLRQPDQRVVLQRGAVVQPVHGRAAAGAEGTLEVPVAGRPQVPRAGPQQARRPGAVLVAGLDQQQQLAGGLGRDHPAAQPAGELAVHVRARDRVVQCRAIGQPQRPGQGDLDKGASVRLLGLVQLVPAVAPGVLAVQQHVERAPDGAGHPDAAGVKSRQLGGHRG